MPCIQNRSRLRHSQNSIATREPIRTVRTRSQLRCMPSETAKPDMTTYIENSATGADKLPRVDTDFTTPLRWGLAVLLVGFRSEEHTSELQSLMRISYAVFCLKKKKSKTHYKNNKTKLQ